jgi:glycerophosphoryl diester phosphodiesterase
VSRKFLNIAHRGFSGRYPENTIRAFKEAIAMGCRWLECDVRLTADGVPVVIHDSTLDRTTDGSGAVSSMAIDDIRALDAGSWMNPAYAGERVPTLMELLDVVDGKAQIVIELKFEPSRIGDVVEIVRNHNAIGWTVASAFEWESVQHVRELAPDWRTTWLTALKDITTDDAIRMCVEAGVDTFGPVASKTDFELVCSAHDAGLWVRCWGLGEDRGPELERLVTIGVDGMTTNHPDALMQILNTSRL